MYKKRRMASWPPVSSECCLYETGGRIVTSSFLRPHATARFLASLPMKRRSTWITPLLRQSWRMAPPVSSTIRSPTPGILILVPLGKSVKSAATPENFFPLRPVAVIPSDLPHCLRSIEYPVMIITFVMTLPLSDGVESLVGCPIAETISANTINGASIPPKHRAIINLLSISSFLPTFPESVSISVYESELLLHLSTFLVESQAYHDCCLWHSFALAYS